MRFLVGFVAAIALVITGCGSDSERASSNTDATALLRSTVTNLQNLKSAAVELKATAGGQSATATGAFERTGAKELPKFTLTGTAAGKSAGATWTGEKGFVTIDGSSYEVPSILVKQLGATTPTVLPDVSKWVSAPRNAGAADVGGVPTIKITGTANVAQIQQDLQFITPLVGHMPKLAGTNATVEVYTGTADSQLRRLVVRNSDGVVDLTLTKVGEQQAIQAPKGARPFSELAGKLGASGLSLPIK
jgi:hypothetical protein